MFSDHIDHFGVPLYEGNVVFEDLKRMSSLLIRDNEKAVEVLQAMECVLQVSALCLSNVLDLHGRRRP